MDGSNVKKMRLRLGLNQLQFWAKIGVTQSGASRYEGGRRIPKPTQAVLLIAYGTQMQAEKEFKRLRAE